MTLLIEPADLMDDLGFFEEREEYIQSLIVGAQSLLANAGAFHPTVPLTKTAVHLIVGHWLENRDSMNYDYKHTKGLPINIQAIINSLQHWAVANDEEVRDETSASKRDEGTDSSITSRESI